MSVVAYDKPEPSERDRSDVEGAELKRFGAALPEGMLQVGAALVVAGTATYLFFNLGNRALGGEVAFKPIVSLWFAIFALAPGFYLPLEQELGRALSARRVRGEGGRPVVMKVLVVAVIINLAVLAILAIGSPLIVSKYFSDNWWMLLALALAFTTYAPAHLARGISAGKGRFGAYALVISADGVLRIVGCLALWAMGVTSPAIYGVMIASTPLFAVLYIWRRGVLHTEDGPDAPWSEVSQNLGWLMAGTVSSAALLNAGPIAAELLAGKSAPALVTRFGYGILLARVPLFLFQAVQAALLPKLARLAEQGSMREFKSGLRTLLLLVGGVGLIGVVGAFLLGPFVIDLMYHTELSGRTLAMLALAAALFMASLATAQAVIALNGHRDVAIGWFGGALAFVVIAAVGGHDVFRRIEIGLVVANIVPLITFALSLRRRLDTDVEITPANLWEAVTDHPLEG